MGGGIMQSGAFQELLAGEAVGDLSGDEARELVRLTAGIPRPGRHDLMATAGVAQLAFLRRDARGIERMPASLEARLMKQAASWSSAPARTASVTDIAAVPRGRAGKDTDTSPAVPRPRSVLAFAGWAVAAALAAAFLVVRPDLGDRPALVTAAELRAELIAAARDQVKAAWLPPTAAGFEAVSGDIVWSNSRQEGYLRLAGLPVNDPADNQYQLWIVDAERSDHPVDGGVFDVTTAGEVTIPVRAKLAVGRPTTFAITLERPGGVVVSDGPLLVVAPLGG